MAETSERRYYLDENGLQTLWAIINARFEALETKISENYMRIPTVLPDTTLPDPAVADHRTIYLVSEENDMDFVPQFYEEQDEHNLLRKKVVKELPSPEEAEPNTIYLLQEEQYEPMYETETAIGDVDYSDQYRDDDSNLTYQEAIDKTINALDSEITSYETVEDENDLVHVTVVQKDGKLSQVKVDNNDVAISMEEIEKIFSNQMLNP